MERKELDMGLNFCLPPKSMWPLAIYPTFVRITWTVCVGYAYSKCPINVSNYHHNSSSYLTTLPLIRLCDKPRPNEFLKWSSLRRTYWAVCPARTSLGSAGTQGRTGKGFTMCRKRWTWRELKLRQNKMALVPNKFLVHGGELKRRCVYFRWKDLNDG